MREKKSQFILLKIPPHLFRLLGKIHASGIEVLGNTSVIVNPAKNLGISVHESLRKAANFSEYDKTRKFKQKPAHALDVF